VKQLQPFAVSSPSQPGEESADRVATRASATGRLRRHWRLILVVSMALVVVGWSILWLVAAQTTAGNLRDWVAQERVLGRKWTCADRRLGGFPFRIEVTCDRPSFHGAVGDAVVAGTLGALFAAAEVYAPTSVAVAVEGPLDMQSSDQRRLHVAWKSLAIDLAFGADGLDRASLVADGPQLHAEAPQFDDFSIDARRAETDFATDPGRLADEAAYDFSFRVDDGRLQALDRLFGDADPTTVQAGGVISHLDAAAGGDLADAAETWRSAGGAIDLTEAVLRKGTTEIEASGHLDLDALHRPHGRIDASGAGLEPVLARYGVPSGALAIDSLLTGLLGSPVESSARAPQALRFPLRLENGRVSIGPVRTPLTLLPLY
jgi:hypothetical protein